VRPVRLSNRSTVSPFLRLLYPPASSLSTPISRSHLSSYSSAQCACVGKNMYGRSTAAPSLPGPQNFAAPVFLCLTNPTPNTPALSAAPDRDPDSAPDLDQLAANSDPPSPAFPASAVSSPALLAAAQDHPAARVQEPAQLVPQVNFQHFRIDDEWHPP
jgi:hypothetical protein